MVIFVVSIPAGFSDALRQDQMNEMSTNKLKVSIPAGFSDALRLSKRALLYIYTKKFQSLLGFLMRCDSLWCSLCMCTTRVSIPAGFSDALRRNIRTLLGEPHTSFNPCWVF